MLRTYPRLENFVHLQDIIRFIDRKADQFLKGLFCCLTVLIYFGFDKQHKGIKATLPFKIICNITPNHLICETIEIDREFAVEMFLGCVFTLCVVFLFNFAHVVCHLVVYLS
jgi:hypothetical protein